MLDPLGTFDLDGKVALVTGASSGLGARFAQVLTAAGANVAITARRHELLKSLAETLPSAMAFPSDITIPADRSALVSAIEQHFGRLDILVNSAGIADQVPAEEELVSDFTAVINTNLVAAFALSQSAARLMMPKRCGTIVNVASILGMVGVGQMPQAAYAASKGGLINLSRELAAQWARRGIRVNTLCPGWFASEMTSELFASEKGGVWLRRRIPMGRPGRADELDGALLFLASDASRYMTGATLVIDGGYTAI